MKTLYAEKKYFCDFMFDDMGLKEYVNQAKAYDIDIWTSLLKGSGYVDHGAHTAHTAF